MLKDKKFPLALAVSASLNLLFFLLLFFMSMSLLYNSLQLTFHKQLENTFRAHMEVTNMEDTDVHIGSWGGKGGSKPWIFIPDGRISQIHISTGDCVDSIRFTYTDHAGVKHHSERYGGHGGSPQTITFADDEKHIAIVGTVGLCGNSTVIMVAGLQT